MGIEKAKVCLAALVLVGGLIGALFDSGIAQADESVDAQGNVGVVVDAAEPVDSTRFYSIVGRRRLWKEWRVN